MIKSTVGANIRKWKISKFSDNIHLFEAMFHGNDEQKFQNYNGRPRKLPAAKTKVTKATIRNTVWKHENEFCSVRPVPLLKPVNVQAPLQFARQHLEDPQED